jgi:GNAT superfamily N-acetyltransferase
LSRTPAVDPARLEQERGRAHFTLAAVARTVASGRMSASLAVAGGAAVYTWPDAPFNEAFGIGWSDEPAEPALEALETFYRERSAPCAIGLADPAPAVWRDLLFRRGYRLRDSLYLWAQPLAAADAGGCDGRIARVSDETGREAWALAVAGGFADGRPLSAFDIDVARVVARLPGTELFVGHDRSGAVVAGGALQVTGDAAYLFSDATLPEARGQGLQGALLAARMAWARERGARVATVQTDPTGPSRRNVERAGFTIAYTMWTLVSPEA